MKLDENLSKEATKRVKIFASENLVKADVSKNDITIPDNNNRISIGYY